MTAKLLIAGILLLAIYVARKPRPVENRQGKQFKNVERQQNQTSQNLVVATYNVQTGKNLQGQRDIKRAAEVVKDVDIVGIQEVYAPGWLNRLGFGICQTQSLAMPGNFSWLFSPTRYRWFRENRGNAILNKLVVKNWVTQNLPDESGISYRNMTTMNFDFGGENCHFINAHLHTGKGKTAQLKALLSEFNKFERVILVGDFNLSLDSPELTRGLEQSGAVDAISISQVCEDTARIDWILLRGWKVISAEKLEKGISDHPFYKVSLSLK